LLLSVVTSDTYAARKATPLMQRTVPLSASWQQRQFFGGAVLAVCRSPRPSS